MVGGAEAAMGDDRSIRAARNPGLRHSIRLMDHALTVGERFLHKISKFSKFTELVGMSVSARPKLRALDFQPYTMDHAGRNVVAGLAEAGASGKLDDLNLEQS